MKRSLGGACLGVTAALGAALWFSPGGRGLGHDHSPTLARPRRPDDGQDQAHRHHHAADDPSTCHSDIGHPNDIRAWTDLTYLLHKHRVSWGYYIFEGTQPDADDGGPETPTTVQKARTPSVWNPLLAFTTVKKNGQLDNIQPIDSFLDAAQKGTMPAVSWVTPD